MSPLEITYKGTLPIGTDAVLVPAGIAVPQGQSVCTNLSGTIVADLAERHTGQRVLQVKPDGPDFALTYRCDPNGAAPYPEAMFTPTTSRFTRSAEALLDEVSGFSPDASGLDRARAIACATAERFIYGHPETRFTDGLDAVPALGCGLTEGSCVDINTYFIAALRAVGIEAGYVTGYFFPQEKGGSCADGHCWVVTRINGACQEWDIAHHLKMGRRDIQPALNPKPGNRVACFHSMGLCFPTLGIDDAKVLIEPVPLVAGRFIFFETPTIRCTPVPALAD